MDGVIAIRIAEGGSHHIANFSHVMKVLRVTKVKISAGNRAIREKVYKGLISSKKNA